jgi:alcohol dehydrogenase (cytochrome c)
LIITGDIKKNVHLRYPNVGGTLATGGDLIFLGLTDGTVAAYDDVTLAELWKTNVGSGFNAPPMTFEVNGKQYEAIASGLYTTASTRWTTRRNSRVRIPTIATTCSDRSRPVRLGC